MSATEPADELRIVALYRFFSIADPQALRDELQRLCRQSGINGTLIIAAEGINGTVAGTGPAVEGLVERLMRVDGFAGAEIKYSTAAEPPFRRLKVRLKREIVTMGVAGFDGSAERGSYVDPEDWNALIDDPDTVLVDTRNAYETAIGTFEGAIDPQTATFREFPDWLEQNRDHLQGRKLAMFCTGGIRCEKATAYARTVGLDQVYHLKGGILKYLETISPQDSRWSGECFVFDERVTVAHGLERGEASLCRACRHPLTAEDRQSADYVEGISCSHCLDQRSDEDRRRYAQRQRQVERALQRGEPHPIGRRQEKAGT